jgi:alpha-beta hydrolase superfamily lysophospholipase
MIGVRNLILSGSIAVILFLESSCMPLVQYPGKPVLEPRYEQGRFVAADGVQLPTRSWLPHDREVRAVIVALHGFNEYSNSFTIPGSYLSRRGIAFYAYDQRGFGGAPVRGLWSGTAAYTQDLACFARVIHKRHPDVPLYILGESMGGAVAIVALTGDNPPDVEGVILVAPAVWGRETMPWYQSLLLNVASHTLPWLELTGKGLNVVPSDNLDVRRSLYLDPQIIKGTRIDTLYGLTGLMDEALLRAGKLQVPVLVQYGKKDRIIPKEPMLRMLESMPKTTTRAFYDQGYHLLLRDLHGEKPMIDIAAWIGDHNTPLPYGTSDWK